MRADPSIAGVILAGGGGRRMFPQAPRGGEKGLVPLAGRALVTHVLDRIRPQVGGLALNTNSDTSLYAGLNLPMIPDHTPDQGPLAGLLAAMAWAKTCGRETASLLSVSTDTPFLPLDLVARLRAALANTDGTRPAIAQSAGRWHPVIGLWPLSLHENLKIALNSGHRSAERFAHANAAIAVSFAFVTIGGESVDPFFNANTPDDLARAEGWLSR